MTVTVTRSHQGAVEVRVVAESAEADVKARAAIARNTGSLHLVSRSGDPIAAAVQRRTNSPSPDPPNARRPFGVRSLDELLDWPAADAAAGGDSAPGRGRLRAGSGSISLGAPIAANHMPQKKWGPALLPAPTAPSEGSAGVRNLAPEPEGP